MIFLALFWCILTATCDVGFLGGILGQARSYWFKPATARIISSEVKREPGSESDTYSVRMEFVYSVDGKEYSSERYSFEKVNWSDSSWARRAVRENPAGAERVCYYDAWNPARAIIQRGLEGRDIFLLMFLTPFNMAGGFLLWAAFWGRRYDYAKLAPTSLDKIQNRETWSMARFSSIGLSLAMFGLTTFLGLFVAIIPNGFPPSMLKVGSIWGVAFAISIAFTIVFRGREKAGRYDLVLDHNARQISVPAMHKRTAAETISFADVRAIQSRAITKGSGEDASETYEIHLQTQDGRDFFLKEEFSAIHSARLAAELAKRIAI
jgi:hypothetical protein